MAATDAANGRITVDKFVAYLNRQGITEEELGRVSRLSMWQTVTKDGEGAAQIHDLHGIQLAPSWHDEPAWPVVQPAAPVRLTKSSNRSVNGTRTIVILPDPQIGFRRMADGEMIPMHDPDAIGAALAVARAVKPDRIVNLGDTLDFAEWSSKFTVLPEFVLTTQPTLDEGHRFLARQRELCERVELLGGNHDDRLGNAIARNAMAALRLRPGGSPPDSWPVLSIPFLLNLDTLDVTYTGAYPAGRVPLTAGTATQAPLVAIHGDRLDVVKVARESRQSIVQGHIHRQSLHSETYELDGRPWHVMAFSPGCLCRIDGAVPSTKGGVDEHGRPVTRWENWQQGCAVITEHDDGAWAAELVPIHRGTAWLRGKAYSAT